ncbi:MAG: hypothetical protein U0414_00840 [Polyangiaceae bacterium]
MARLVVCGACERHVHETENQCPFCDAPIAVAPRDAVTHGLSRAAQYALGAAILTSAAVSASCSDSPTSKSPVDANTAGGSTGTSTPVGTTTSTTTATGTSVATSRPGETVCGDVACPAGQYCFHPCTPCGGRAAQAGHCPPAAPARCMAGSPPQGDQLQGNDVYQNCPAMPYGCVFPNDCGRLSV